MTEQQMVDAALEAGFLKCVWMDVQDLVFDHSLRKYCEMNTCGNYGKNYACPPDCGTPQDMEIRARKYRRALVMQTITKLQDIMDPAEVKAVRGRHNGLSMQLEHLFREEGVRGTWAMAGPCPVCKKCAGWENAPCRNPDRIYSCVSAYCINASDMAERCGMEYWCKDNRVAFFTVFFAA